MSSTQAPMASTRTWKQKKLWMGWRGRGCVGGFDASRWHIDMFAVKSLSLPCSLTAAIHQGGGNCFGRRCKRGRYPLEGGAWRGLWQTPCPCPAPCPQQRGPVCRPSEAVHREPSRPNARCRTWCISYIYRNSFGTKFAHVCCRQGEFKSKSTLPT